MMLSVRGIFENGVARPVKPIKNIKTAEIIITFLDEKIEEKVTKKESQKNYLWQRLKESITKEYPELRKMTKEEAVEEFERLSEKVRENMEFKDWREMERYMKGDYYDLAGF